MLLVVASSCGGSVRDDAPLPAEASLDGGASSPEADEPSVDAEEPSPDARGASSSEADASADESTDASANIYVPTGAPVPYDPEDLPGGSFEEAQGHGFDTCPTRTPGRVAYATAPAASEGAAFLQFTASTCAANPVCSASGSQAQLFLWAPSDSSHEGARGLYFDMIDLGSSLTEGSLSFYSVDATCGGAMPVIEVRLADLALASSWRTRCVPVTGPPERLGIAITGTAYDVGLDAVRFGGPCR